MSARGRAASPGAIVVSLLAMTSSASADLRGDVDRLAAGFRAAGADVHIRSPRVLVGGARTWVAPEEELPGVESPGRPGCTSVIVLGGLGATFVVRVPSEGETKSDELQPSSGGYVQLTSCGPERAALASAVLEVRSPRMIVETVVAHSTLPLPDVGAVLTNRDSGAEHPPENVGAAPAPGPLAERRVRVEQAFLRSGLALDKSEVLTADAHGDGGLSVALRAGCHAFALLGAPPRLTQRYDLDAELITDTARVTDRTDAADARVLLCVGEPQIAGLSFSGAPAGAAVHVLRASHPIPESIPESWGPDARAALLRTMIERALPVPKRPPVFEALGAAGLTTIPVDLSPGRCYLATAARLGGDERPLALSFRAGPLAPTAQEDVLRAPVVTLCSRSDHGTLDVEAHGASFLFVTAIWALSPSSLGEPAE